MRPNTLGEHIRMRRNLFLLILQAILLRKNHLMNRISLDNRLFSVTFQNMIVELLVRKITTYLTLLKDTTNRYNYY